MHIKEEFTSYALRLLIAILSLVVMIPVYDSKTLYVPALVFALGQFIDLLGKILFGRNKLLFIFYIIGIFVGIVAISMCICPWVSENLRVNFNNYNVVIIALNAFFCVLNIVEFIIYLFKIYHTKSKLHHF